MLEHIVSTLFLARPNNKIVCWFSQKLLGSNRCRRVAFLLLLLGTGFCIFGVMVSWSFATSIQNPIWQQFRVGRFDVLYRGLNRVPSIKPSLSSEMKFEEMLKVPLPSTYGCPESAESPRLFIGVFSVAWSHARRQLIRELEGFESIVLH